jgi:phosphate transport system permease protein
MKSANHRSRSRRAERAFGALALAAIVLPLLLLSGLLLGVLWNASARLGWDFLTSYPSRKPELAGILPGFVGSLYLMLLTALIALPLGVGAAIYLEEYGKRSRLSRIIEINIANLAGVPSIVYGILGLALFVRALGFDRSILSGALTLSLLVLPVIIMASQEAIRAVPQTIREAAYGLGATRWQVVSHQVLPMAFPGILTGTILALSRAVGETAPLILVGAVGFVAFTPRGVMDQFTVLPLQIYSWISRPQDEFRELAAAGIIVLLLLLLTMNAAAIILRNRAQARR